MANTDFEGYAQEFSSAVRAALGPAAPIPALDRFVAAGAALTQAASAAPDDAAWNAALAEFEAAKSALKGTLRTYLLAGLPQVPALAELASAVDWSSVDGLSGSFELGPFKLGLASSSLVVLPKHGGGLSLPTVQVGPLRPVAVHASLAMPGVGKGLGGGALVRLENGFGGTMSLPLGPVVANASAALTRLLPDGAPSVFAILGLTFRPPIQLSFGFSLDRVGGIAGINRQADTDALATAVRTGAAGNVLFAESPSASPVSLLADVSQLFPDQIGLHVVGPTVRLSWLSLDVGSLMSLDVGVVVEFPSVKFVIVGVARIGIPGLPGLLNLRLDVLGQIDPAQSLVSIDASLVDSHALGVFKVYGDGALRLSWGSPAYVVLSVGGFYPGFNPEPARLPALRRVGMSLDLPVGPMSMRAQGYFAVTTNTIQLGALVEASISCGLSAHGFLQVDALVQFRPFFFTASCAAGFDVRAGGFSFGGVRLDGTVSGPGPLTVRGRLTIETFLFDISWDETFSFGSASKDVLQAPATLLDLMKNELDEPRNLQAESMQDPAVVLNPRPRSGEQDASMAVVPPSGALRFVQRRAPLGLLIDRVDGMPLAERKGVVMAVPGSAVMDRFSPGSYCTLTQAEALNRPPFDLLTAGIVLSPQPEDVVPPACEDKRTIHTIVIRVPQQNTVEWLKKNTARFDLQTATALVGASLRPPALSDDSALVTALPETWTTVGAGAGAAFNNATAAFQAAKHSAGPSVALAKTDSERPVKLEGVLA